MINRRQFIQSTFSAGLVSLLPFRFDRLALNEADAQSLDFAHPIQMLPSTATSSLEFNGDSITRTHDILWNVDGFVQSRGGWPKPTEKARVVVVGGGVAGLSATYFLRGQDPILLEQAENFGGNSRGEQLGGSRYSLGAAYIPMPEKGTVTARLLNDLQLLPQIRIEDPTQTEVLHGNRLVEGFWQGNTAPEARAQFVQVFKRLQSMRGRLGLNNQLDRITFAQWLAQEFGQVHPHIVEYFQLYCWSSFAASIEELSALQALDFITSDSGPIMAMPGGNSAVTGRLYERLRRDLRPDRLRTNAIVIDVRLVEGGVNVTYADSANQLKCIFAEKVVYAAPKLVALRTMNDIPSDQKRAMSNIRYRAYIVANIFLRAPLKSPTFDLFHLQNQIPEPPSAMKQNPRPFTDIIFGTWAQHDKTQTPVLTVYKAYPFDGARQFIMNPIAHDKIRGQIIPGLEPLFSSLGLKASDIRGARMTRWGHSLPVASAGMIAGGVAELASKPIADRIYFANQDNWVNPCFETAAEAAHEAASLITGSVL